MLSFSENIPIILNAVDELKPQSVFDIGAGFGKYGLLLREQYLSRKTADGELSPVDDFIIDAVEDTRYFIRGHNGWRLNDIYNGVFEYPISDMHLFIDESKEYMERYDLVLLIDIIEHWTLEFTKDILLQLSEHCNNILISTPIEVTMYQQHYYGDSRHHITQYSGQDLVMLNPFKYSKRIASPLSHIVMYSRNSR